MAFGGWAFSQQSWTLKTTSTQLVSRDLVDAERLNQQQSSRCTSNFRPFGFLLPIASLALRALPNLVPHRAQSEIFNVTAALSISSKMAAITSVLTASISWSAPMSRVFSSRFAYCFTGMDVPFFNFVMSPVATTPAATRSLIGPVVSSSAAPGGTATTGAGTTTGDVPSGAAGGATTGGSAGVVSRCSEAPRFCMFSVTDEGARTLSQEGLKEWNRKDFFKFLFRLSQNYHRNAWQPLLYAHIPHEIVVGSPYFWFTVTKYKSFM